ncbi:MAG: FMN-binding protein [Bacteroidales bacterium]|nr:FMN-binding protein [Bacteroidales bacterium]
MKRHLKFLVIGLAALMFLACSCNKLQKEHEEARNVEISAIDFSLLKTGIYDGYYAGGMYQWRENECRVEVDSGRVIDIELIESEAEYTLEFLDSLYGCIIRQQNLQVDAVCGATLDTKACLKGVEDALIKAL